MFPTETDFAAVTLAQPFGGSTLCPPPELPPVDHRGPFPSWLQKHARCMFSSGKSKHYMVDCSLREDNVWLLAVKPQIASRQIRFWTLLLLFRWQIIIFKLSGLPFHGHGASEVNLWLCHDFIQFCYSQPFNI